MESAMGFRRIYMLIIMSLTLGTNATFGQPAPDVALLIEVRKACAGLTSLIANNGTGTVKLQQYDLTVDAGKDVNVYHEGVLLKSVKDFDYLDCLKSLSTIYLQLQKKSEFPRDILGQILLGRVGKTSEEFVKSVLGTPRYGADDRDEFAIGGYVLQTKFLQANTGDGAKGRVIGVRVYADLSDEKKEATRPQFLLRNAYWNQMHSLNEKGDEQIDYRVSPDGVLGKTTLREFGLDDCFVDYVDDEDRNAKIFFCKSDGYGSQDFIDVKLYIKDDKADLYAYSQLSNYFDKLEAEDLVSKYPDVHGKWELQNPRFQVDIPSEEVASRWIEEYKLGNKTPREALDEITVRMKSIALDCIVVGLQFNVAGGDLDPDPQAWITDDAINTGKSK
jgi:hypothetical protein